MNIFKILLFQVLTIFIYIQVFFFFSKICQSNKNTNTISLKIITYNSEKNWKKFKYKYLRLYLIKYFELIVN
jgi:hypothetical protein